MKKDTASVANHFDEICTSVLSMDEVKETIINERKWLHEHNAISAVTDGPVEDLEGIPLPADLLRGEFPPTHNDPSPGAAGPTKPAPIPEDETSMLLCDVVGDEGGGGISAGGIPSSTGGAIKKR